jgi:coenzyme F420 biosynthesis associated uncharacterized protein
MTVSANIKRHDRSSQAQDRTMLAAGTIAGAAIGAWLGRRIHDFARTERPAGMIDWERARAIALNMNRGHALTAAERDHLNRYYGELVDRCIPIVAEYTGTNLPTQPERTYAFDRIDWIHANLEGFQRMFAPIEQLDQQRSSTTFAARLWGGVNQAVLSYEIGLLLGYLARRVLGQYDLALLGREPVTTGKLYYVEPNIRSIEHSLRLPRDDFRMWLALHETTHAFEFEAYPWVRVYFNDLLERYMEFMKEDAEQLKQGMRGLKVFVERARRRPAEQSSWMEALMSPDQRQLFLSMQALMCVVEGYSNHVMNAVGRNLLANYELISRRFEERQRQRTPAEQLFARLTGLDVKMEQYRAGERFIDEIVRLGGSDAMRRIWESPASVPTMDEIRDPSRWLTRVQGGVAPAAV